jgi:hypothetical protein
MQFTTQPRIPNSRCLLQPIESFVKLTMIIWMQFVFKTWRLPHICRELCQAYKYLMQESIIHI